jgi:acetyltransferase-like isoleucine patch superfamily enzyme
MVPRLILYILRLLFKPFKILRIQLKHFNNFVVLNIDFLISNRIEFKEPPKCNQKIKLTGEGYIQIGSGCMFGFELGGFHHGGSIEIQPRNKNSVIKIGNNVATNNNIFICAANEVEIEDDTLIGQNVTIMDHEAHGTASHLRRQVGKIGSVTICKNVWIGNNVIILKNTEIGENTIVAAGSVVSGKFPANAIIGGIPSKVIKLL